MIRSMYSGVTGLQNHQQKLDVIGNNIANVNTFGFKKGRYTFQDMLSQTVQGASGSAGDLGGTNPRQIGLGVQTGSIDTIHTQGALQPTGRELDLGIAGDGYFRVGPQTDATDANTLYTRAGNFYLDEEGYIVNSNGHYLLGEDGNGISIPTDAESFSIGSDGGVYVVGGTGIGEDGLAGTIQLATFPNPEGLEKVGGNLYRQSPNSGEPGDPVTPGEGGSGTLVAGALEMSNVDLSEEFVEMITAQRGLQANSRIITTSDEVLQELLNLK
ncbi:flagellar basal body rod protein FlgG [Geomicrobium sp. JCM 19039]|uniref:flagellar basal body rod protein FlgG n=1 Tax=Geomicrobium sp. JCM 19039 TaxID=1460636 RepID=UPI00045F3DD6|nr:flagellar basal body rod protein FlgG [Geomicrobium sp. JCM 19039]GAK10928.1 flagellar hook protein FlgE [Geomicrobium sp. JCM 19039]